MCDDMPVPKVHVRCEQFIDAGHFAYVDSAVKIIEIHGDDALVQFPGPFDDEIEAQESQVWLRHRNLRPIGTQCDWKGHRSEINRKPCPRCGGKVVSDE